LPSGEGDPGDEIIAERPSDPPTEGEAQVPYNEVFPIYSDVAYDAIEGGEVPVTLKPVVRDYFSSLDPNQ